MLKHAPPPNSETLQSVLHQANEPIRLFLELLFQASDTSMELSVIAALGETLQETTSARIDAIFRVVDKQIGVIKLTGVPESHELVHKASWITATLENPKKSE